MRALFAGYTRAWIAVLATMLPLAACGSSVQTTVPSGDSGVPADYPVSILESPERREAARAGWERLFDDYGVPSERRRIPDLNPFIYTPQSFLGSGPIPLATASAEQVDEERIRLLLREFIVKRAELLGVTPDQLSLVEVIPAATGTKRFSYTQAGYPHPIAPPSGRLEFIVTDAGQIIQIVDTAIPVVRVPTDPRISREAAQQRVVGTTFTYGDIAGRPQQVTITDVQQVRVERLVIYPEQTEAALRIRLVWEITAGEGLTWTVFLDAITGETVGTRQNFQT